MQTNILKIAYQGEALRNGTMELRDLAPALLAFSGFVESVNAIVNQKDFKLAIHVKSFEKGSFGIELIIADASLLSQFLEPFAGTNASAIANLLEILGASVLGGKGIFWLIQKLRKSRSVVAHSADTVTITLEDGETLQVAEPLYRAASDALVQRYLFEALKPVSKEGIDSFQMYSSETPSEITTEITKETLRDYEPAEQTEILTSDVRVQYCTIVDLSFEKTEWRLSDGESTFNVTIEDKDFLQSVRDTSVVITPSTQLKVEIKTEQRRVIKNLRTTRTLLRVLEIKW